MNWEEYQNSDWYRESHPEVYEKPSKDDLIFAEMCSCVGCIEYYRKEGYLRDDKAKKEGKVVCYIVTKLWNCRVRGIIASGGYEYCRRRQYEYNVACIDSEWESAGVERIVANDEDELEETLNGYRDVEFDYDDYDYDYDY